MSTNKPFHERGSFRAAVAVLGLAGGLWAFLGAPTPWKVATELASNPLPLRNTEIILDASSRMGARFGQATKLEIAAEAVDRYAAASEHIGLALRRVGGSCDDPYEPEVGFDNGHGDDVAAAAGTMQPSGSSNLGLAVLSAINDFSGEAFHRPGSENQIVIFAGGGDQCGDRTGREIRHQLEQADIHPEFHVYAIKVSKGELKSLKAMKRQLKPVAPVELDQADNVQQLYRAVREDAEQTGNSNLPATQAGGEEHPAQAEHQEAKPSLLNEDDPEARSSSSGDEAEAAGEAEKEEKEKEAAKPKEEEEAQQKEREKEEELEQEEGLKEEEERQQKELEAVEERELGKAEEAATEETGGKAEGG